MEQELKRGMISPFSDAPISTGDANTEEVFSSEEEAADQTAEYETGYPGMLGEADLEEPVAEQEGVGQALQSIRVVAAPNVPVTAGEYAFHQGAVKESGKLDANGRAYFSKIDPSQPFLFEVRDRV